MCIIFIFKQVLSDVSKFLNSRKNRIDKRVKNNRYSARIYIIYYIICIQNAEMVILQ